MNDIGDGVLEAEKTKAAGRGGGFDSQWGQEG